MKIGTWNINECVGITCNLDNQKTSTSINKENIKEIIEKINECDFDIICFQEYPTNIDESNSLTEEIINKTKLKYYVEKDTYDSYLFKGGRVGVAIFSKYEIKESYITQFINPNIIKKNSKGNTYYSYDKAIIKIKVKVENEDYTVITGHAIAFAPFDKSALDFPESYKPLEKLINDCSNTKLIVLGDFNSEKLFDLIPNAKNVVTDIINMPTTKDYYEKSGEVQMDYILINDKIKASKIYKIDNFSDHYIIGASII